MFHPGYKCDRGSSPLARGLPHGCRAQQGPSRIIPARAGFTLGCGHLVQDNADHPRSRGVYGKSFMEAGQEGGSSPLARGLRPSHSSPGRAPGIIPARAGFTTECPRLGSSFPDHPRSRGVYRGSRPLVLSLGGIIPARAGFTRWALRWSAICRDHPRSRGVYGPSSGGGVVWEGSSPLARGLLEDGHAIDLDGRIIPARAGFTTSRPKRSESTKDHPRSRGVYEMMRVMIISAVGSSPLARGLRRFRRVSCAPIGIIPARAGFTVLGRGAPFLSPDHPRSRGVYPDGFCGQPEVEGSSPLARGLRGM